MNKNSENNPTNFTFIHPNIRIFWKTVLLNVAVLLAFRIFFLVKYYSLFTQIEFGELFFSFLNGWRFDLATIFLIYWPFFILLFLPGRWVITKTFHSIFKYLVIGLLGLQTFILLADLGYYQYVDRHLSGELMNLSADFSPMLKLVVSSYYLYFLAWIALVILVGICVKKLFRFKPGPDVKFKNRTMAFPLHLSRSAVYIFLLLALSVVAIRGGLQAKPLRVSYAFLNDKVVLGHLSLNGIYTTLQAVSKSEIDYNIPCDYQAAVKTVTGLLGDKNTQFLDKKYPLLRRNSPEAKKATLPNIVIFIMESWSADSVGVLAGKHNLTPNFDKLAEKGRLFTNFFSVGQRSIDAVASILYSFPSFTGCTTVGKVYEQNQMLGIGNILNKEGYSTIFICGAKRGSMGFDAFAKKAGFDRYIAKDDFDLPRECFDGTWGVFDEYTFLRADEEFRKMNTPFLSVVYSLNPHAPYKIPSKRSEKVAKGKNAPYYNALSYSDWTLGNYFKHAQGADYFDNTLFIILADHPEGHHEQSVIDSFRIPCLFYFPGRIPPGVDEGVASQMDILPAIIDFSSLPSIHSSLGKSLFASRKKSAFRKNSALLGYGNIFGWVRDDYVLLHSIDKPVGFYDYKKDKAFSSDLSGEYPAMVKTYENELFSTLKIATTLLRDNRIAPLKY